MSDIGQDLGQDIGLDITGPRTFIAALPVVFTLTVTVDNVLNLATSAIKITDFGSIFGPFAAQATANQDGTFTLTVPFTEVPAGLLPNPSVTIQPGDWPNQADPGTFTPYGDSVQGQLTGTQVSTSLDWDVTLTGPYVDIATMTTVIDAAGTEWVHVGAAATDTLSGQVLLLTGNTNVVSTEMAIVHGSPQERDWLPATLISRAAGDALDGEYLCVKVGAGGSTSLTVGTWRVWARLTTTGETIALKAPGYLTVV